MSIISHKCVFLQETSWLFSLPKGLNKINKEGNNVNDAKSAVSIARPVRRPKYIVGIKFDKDKIEKPITIIDEV